MAGRENKQSVPPPLEVRAGVRRRSEGRSKGLGHALAALLAPRRRTPRAGPGPRSRQVLLGAERDLPPNRGDLVATCLALRGNTRMSGEGPTTQVRS